MRWLALLVLLLAIVAIHSEEDEVETDEATDSTTQTEEEEDADAWIDDGVMILEADNFEEFIKENEFVLVEFYAPWCQYCKSFAPEYVKLANELEEISSPIKVVKVDATKSSKYTDEYDVRGYPTLKLFRKGSHSDFYGQKTVANITGWLNKKTGPVAIEIKSVEGAEEFIKSHEVAVLGFFNDYESEEAKVFLSVADSIDELRCGITKDQDVYTKYEAKSGSIILFKKFDDGKAIFEGELTGKEIQNFIAIHSAPLIMEFNRGLTHIVFSVIKNHFIFFISKEEGHMEKYVEPAREAAKRFRGKVLFVAIDMDVQEHSRILDFFSLKREFIPTARLSHYVGDNHKTYKPKDDDLSPESIMSFVQDGLDGNLKVELRSQILPPDWDEAPVKTLVGTNFEEVALDVDKDVFVVFYSPWNEESKKLAPIFDELGEKYKDSETVVIAKFDATANELDPEHPKIITYPTLRLYKKGDNDIAYYAGKQSVEAFVKFIDSDGEEITPDDVKSSEDEDESKDEDEVKDEQDESNDEDVPEDADVSEDEDEEDEYKFEEDRDEL